MSMYFFRSRNFWLPCILAGVIFGGLILWQLDLLPIPPPLPRPAPTQEELIFSGLLVLLLTLNSGLFFWRRHQHSCPTGTRRATGTAGTLAVVTLLCPSCLFIPGITLGGGFALMLLIPYLPLLRTIAIILLLVNTWLLWPKHGKSF